MCNTENDKKKYIGIGDKSVDGTCVYVFACHYTAVKKVGGRLLYDHDDVNTRQPM